MHRLPKSFFLLTLLFLAVFSGTDVSGIPRNVKKPFRNSQFVSIDSTLIHYRFWVTKAVPSKGKILFIHGFMGSTYSFRKNFDSLCAQGYNIIAMDLPPYGYGSRESGAGYSLSARGSMVWKLLDQIDMGDTARWTIIGHCIGGGAAEAAALLRPSKVRSLILVNSVFFINNTEDMAVDFNPANIKSIKGFYADYIGRFIIDFTVLRNFMKSGYGRMPDTSDTEGFLTPLRIPETNTAIAASFRPQKETVRIECKGLKNIPGLIIWGGKDSWLSARNTKKIRKLWPEAQLHIISTAGHMPMETHPAEFNSVLEKFLSSLP